MTRLVHRGFLSLLAAQFCGAVNDNVLKQILVFMVGSGLWVGKLGQGGAGYVALCLTVPFILVSGFAGQVADRHSKQRVMFFVKVTEIPIAFLAGIGFYLQNLWLTLAAFLALATQSSFFGPAKNGVIPELVEEADLSRANGMINMLTNIAIILGTIIGGPISDMYFPKGDSVSAVRWAPGVALVAVAIVGFF